MTRFAPPGPLGLGGAPLGNLFSPLTEEDAAETVEAAWEAGLRYFDTAPHYGAGLSERRMGEVLRTRPRDEFVISSKVGRLLDADPGFDGTQYGFVDALPFRIRFDYSADAAKRSIEDSLQRLGLPRIDIAFIHDAAEDWHGAGWRDVLGQAMNGAARVLADLKAQGVIRAWGLGVNRIEACLAALDQGDPDVFLVAGRYTLLDTTALDTLFPRCAERGVRVVVGGPYNSGLLAGGDTFEYTKAAPEMLEKARRIGAVCARFGTDLKAAALQFCAAHPVVASVIAGARNASEVRQNAAMAKADIPSALWPALRDEGLIPAHAPTPA